MNKRLFFAADISPDLAKHLRAFKELNFHLPLRWIPSQNWHITTVFIGDFPTKQIPSLITEARPFFSEMAEVSLKLNSIAYNSQKKPRLLWARFENSQQFNELITGISGFLNAFYSRNSISTKIKIRSRNIPHVTLSRLKPNKEYPALNRIADIGHYERIGSIALFESELKATGAVYKKVEEFRLVSLK